ncbi:unnamed protein product [Protopolystoma xenopodis]|uniref:Uncharacterized protein n=1 Tax=Protopolystoma xenopodis TaxID=117903 RepID=A0A448XEW2_9PLAT|nr:unnamed protein product [Protopolystoma xenopodis]
MLGILTWSRCHIRDGQSHLSALSTLEQVAAVATRSNLSRSPNANPIFTEPWCYNLLHVSSGLCQEEAIFQTEPKVS